MTGHDVKPPQPDELHNYWCPHCKTWQMFTFEDWGMCDECAIGCLTAEDLECPVDFC